jgi:hypothetical protein
MASDFHIFVSSGDRVFTVRQEGTAGSRVFSSLAEATRHLREHSLGFVVIHDEEGNSANRIPLGF